MKTIIKTTTHPVHVSCLAVAIFHRAENAIDGGVLVAWLLRNGEFRMPADANEARKIKFFECPQSAAKAAQNAFSVLKHVATL